MEAPNPIVLPASNILVCEMCFNVNPGFVFGCGHVMCKDCYEDDMEGSKEEDVCTWCYDKIAKLAFPFTVEKAAPFPLPENSKLSSDFETRSIQFAMDNLVDHSGRLADHAEKILSEICRCIELRRDELERLVRIANPGGPKPAAIAHTKGLAEALLFKVMRACVVRKHAIGGAYSHVGQYLESLKRITSMGVECILKASSAERAREIHDRLLEPLVGVLFNHLKEDRRGFEVESELIFNAYYYAPNDRDWDSLSFGDWSNGTMKEFMGEVVLPEEKNSV